MIYRRIGLVALFFFVVHGVSAQDNSVQDSLLLSLWPHEPPFSVVQEAEKQLPSKGDGVTRLTNVSKPTLTVYETEDTGSAKPGVIICPGGGYSILAMNLEGSEIAQWMQSLGVVPIVLKYRVPRNRKGALADLQRALSMVRHRAKEWNINPGKIGVIGFSAGAHLAARASTHFDQRIYELVDKNDQENIRPDFTMLIYPAYLVNKKNEIQMEVKVHKRTPPTFLVQTQDDGIRYENSLYFYQALAEKNIPAELHLFARGGHGYGLRTSKNNNLSHWPDLVENWLRSSNILHNSH